MKRRTAPAAGQAVNITPLSDIMLSLLIFFMLVSKAGIDSGADEEIVLPEATLGITQEQFDEERGRSPYVVLNVRSGGIQGNPTVYGKYMFSGEDFEMNVTNPQDADRPLLVPFLKGLKGDLDDFEVYLHADRGTPFWDMEPVQRAISQADVAGVQYAFEQPG